MAPLIVAACIIGLLVAVAAGYGLKIRAEIRRLSPAPTGLIIHDIHAIRDGHVNMYLIRHDDTYVALDAGKNYKAIEQGLKEMNVRKGEIKAVFLTHSDRDHVGGLKLFESAKIYLSRDEDALARGKTRRAFIFGNRIDAPYELVEDDQVVDVGNIRVRCISTPGHTPGSMSYVIDGRYLFTGDTLSLKNGYAGLFSDFFNMDSPAQIESLRRISSLPGIEYVFTAHHGYTDDYGKAFRHLAGLRS